MELHNALQQISAIRQQMARSEVFRGYRSTTIGFSGVLGIVAAIFQPYWAASPATDLGKYLALWVCVATAIVLIAGWDLFVRAGLNETRLERVKTRLAVEQFLPCLAVGALLTVVIFQHAQHVAWVLPGLWSMLFGLGILASRHLLPSQAIWAGAYYIVCGCGCLRFGQDEYAFSPWQMAISFGGGQLLCAAIIYWTLERKHVA